MLLWKHFLVGKEGQVLGEQKEAKVRISVKQLKRTEVWEMMSSHMLQCDGNSAGVWIGGKVSRIHNAILCIIEKWESIGNECLFNFKGNRGEITKKPSPTVYIWRLLLGLWPWTVSGESSFLCFHTFACRLLWKFHFWLLCSKFYVFFFHS